MQIKIPATQTKTENYKEIKAAIKVFYMILLHLKQAIIQGDFTYENNISRVSTQLPGHLIGNF